MQVTFGEEHILQYKGKAGEGELLVSILVLLDRTRRYSPRLPPNPHFRSAGSRLKTTPSAAKEWDMAKKRDDSPSNCCRGSFCKAGSKNVFFLPFLWTFHSFLYKSVFIDPTGKGKGEREIWKTQECCWIFAAHPRNDAMYIFYYDEASF
jgi:hypothetical protein